jgi:hypothetical protein
MKGVSTMPPELATALSELQRLSYDDLTNFVDLADDALGVKRVAGRRKGKTPLDRLPAGDERQAWYAARRLSKDDLRIVRDMAATLRDALKPQEKRRRDESGQAVARGYVQVKYITRPVLNRDTGEVELKTFGPYLYLRVWATGGNRDRQGKRLKNRYIGMKTLAAAFEAGHVTGDDIIDAYEAGTLPDLQKQVAGLG